MEVGAVKEGTGGWWVRVWWHGGRRWVGPATDGGDKRRPRSSQGQAPCGRAAEAAGARWLALAGCS